MEEHHVRALDRRRPELPQHRRHLPSVVAGVIDDVLQELRERRRRRCAVEQLVLHDPVEVAGHVVEKRSHEQRLAIEAPGLAHICADASRGENRHAGNEDALPVARGRDGLPIEKPRQIERYRWVILSDCDFDLSPRRFDRRRGGEEVLAVAAGGFDEVVERENFARGVEEIGKHCVTNRGAGGQDEQVTRLKNADKKTDPWKQHADNLDAFVYMVLVDAGVENGAMRDFLYRDRVELAVYGKAMFGLALHKQNESEKLAMIMQNIEQFLVQDEENETAYLKLPNDNYWWYWYGSETEANAYYLKLLSKTDPKGERAPRLVKYLLNNRKHATFWNSTRDTALCVEAFADYIQATGETEPDMFVEVWMDGAKVKEVQINKDNLFTYDNKFVLTAADVKDGSHEIELRRRFALDSLAG